MTGSQHFYEEATLRDITATKCELAHTSGKQECSENLITHYM